MPLVLYTLAHQTVIPYNRINHKLRGSCLHVGRGTEEKNRANQASTNPWMDTRPDDIIFSSPGTAHGTIPLPGTFSSERSL
jgi:hypothetical protein